jgi:type VI secretion system secreted protein VgrG
VVAERITWLLYRLLRMHFPHDDAPDPVMLPNHLEAFEALSYDFIFTVEVLSTNAKIALKDMQGKNVTVSLVRADGQLRHFNGYVFEFRQVRTDGGYAFYDMVLLPWLAYLRMRRDNYLFHGMNALEQTEDIFADYATVRDWQVRIQGEIPAVTDQCQWDESDYNYLHRRWEALGWHYWYEHREDGHSLVLANDSLRRAMPSTAPRPRCAGRPRPAPPTKTASATGSPCAASCPPRWRWPASTSRSPGPRRWTCPRSTSRARC